jgi:hypothetical protein
MDRRKILKNYISCPAALAALARIRGSVGRPSKLKQAYKNKKLEIIKE